MSRPEIALPTAPGGGARFTWWGHATVAFEIGGVKVITDPVLTDWVGLLRRDRTIEPGAIARPDVVLISHLHLDHLHAPSLALLGEDLHIVVPDGGRRLLEGVPAGRITQVRPGDRVDLGGVSLEVHPAEHSAHRWPFGRITAPAVGYVVRGGTATDQRSVYFAGDTDLFAGMAHLGPIDIAAIPIWGWGPTLGPGHLDPERAARSVELVDPVQVVPVHWGTYHPARVRGGPPAWFHRPITDFTDHLARLGARHRVRRLEIGDPWTWGGTELRQPPAGAL